MICFGSTTKPKLKYKLTFWRVAQSVQLSPDACMEERSQEGEGLRKRRQRTRCNGWEHSGGGNEQRCNDDYVLVWFSSYACHPFRAQRVREQGKYVQRIWVLFGCVRMCVDAVDAREWRAKLSHMYVVFSTIRFFFVSIFSVHFVDGHGK